MGNFRKDYQPLLHVQWVLGALQWLEERGVKTDSLKDYIGYLSIAAINPHTGYQISGPNDKHPGGWPGPQKYHVKQMQSLPFILKWALEKGEKDLIDRIRKTVDYKISTYITEDWDVVCEIGLVASHEAMEFAHGIYLTWLLETDEVRKENLWHIFLNLVKRYMTENIWSVTMDDLKFICYRKGELEAFDSYATWQIIFNAYLAGFEIEDLAPYAELMYRFREIANDPRVNNSWYYGYEKLNNDWLSFGPNTSYILPYAIYALNLTGYSPKGDTISPTVEIIYPVEGSKISDSVNVESVVKDDFGIVRIEFLEDGTPIDWRTFKSSREVNFIWKWEISHLEEGNHTIEITAYDKEGNRGSQRVSVIISQHVKETPTPTITPTASPPLKPSPSPKPTPTTKPKPTSTITFTPSPPPQRETFLTETYPYSIIGIVAALAIVSIILCIVYWRRR